MFKSALKPCISVHKVPKPKFQLNDDATIQNKHIEAGNYRSLPPEDDGIDRGDDKLDSNGSDGSD